LKSLYNSQATHYLLSDGQDITVSYRTPGSLPSSEEDSTGAQPE